MSLAGRTSSSDILFQVNTAKNTLCFLLKITYYCAIIKLISVKAFENSWAAHDSLSSNVTLRLEFSFQQDDYFSFVDSKQHNQPCLATPATATYLLENLRNLFSQQLLHKVPCLGLRAGECCPRKWGEIVYKNKTSIMHQKESWPCDTWKFWVWKETEKLFMQMVFFSCLLLCYLYFHSIFQWIHYVLGGR